MKMSIFIKLLSICFVLLLPIHYTKADENLPDWMNSSINGLSNLFSSCIVAPNLSTFISGSKNLTSTNSSSNSGVSWQSSGSYVSSGKFLKIDWKLSSLSNKPRKYLVLYRIDPRFDLPQVFIQSYDYTQNKYISDFHRFNNGILTTYQMSESTNFIQRINDYTSYFNYNGRTKIPVYSGDVINITLAEASDFFNSNNEFTNELDTLGTDNKTVLSLIYTKAPSPNNTIVYSTAQAWCNSLNTNSTTASSLVCNNNTYKNTSDLFAPIVGKPYEPKFNDFSTRINNPITKCTEGANTPNSLCLYDKGRGMKIMLNDQAIKNTPDSFLTNTNNKNFFYYKSNVNGSLDFITDWQMSNMFINYNPLMNNWSSFSNYNDYAAYLNNSSQVAVGGPDSQNVTMYVDNIQSSITDLINYLYMLTYASYFNPMIANNILLMTQFNYTEYDNFISLSNTMSTNSDFLMSMLTTIQIGLYSIEQGKYDDISSFLVSNSAGVNNLMSVLQSNITSYINYLNQYASFSGIDQMMNIPILANYPNLSSALTNNLNILIQYLAVNPIIYETLYNIDFASSLLHFGRYIMQVEIGAGEANGYFGDSNPISVEYIISDSEPSASTAGTIISNSYRANANQSGYLWFRITNTSDTVAAVNINYSYYSGTTWFSDIIANNVVNPLKTQFNSFSQLFYNRLITNTTLQKIARTMLTLYICFYALFFLAGAVKITVQDLIIRVIKISIVIALFSQNSWNFFNNNLFNVFVSGADYLMINILGATSNANNVFSFIDPILEKYTNPKIWQLLFIQLLQIHNGLTFFAIMVIYSLLLYFRAVIEVIVGYCMAFVGLAVMISLAPFFIILILFERTRSIFDNWLSVLLDYVVQPTVLLIFFLLIDEVMSAQLVKVVAGQACWECLLPIRISLNIDNTGFLGQNFNFTIPWFPCISFYVPRISVMSGPTDLINNAGTYFTLASSSLLFYAYCLMSRGLVDYVSVVVSLLTNVTPARQEGNIQSPSNPTESIINDMKSFTGAAASYATAPIRAPLKVFKDKVIDQNFRSKPSSTSEKEDSSTEQKSGNNKDTESKKD